MDATQAFRAMRRLLRRTWQFAREVSGDDAYERYLEHLTSEHPESTPLNRSDYYKRRQDQKWNGITRCC